MVRYALLLALAVAILFSSCLEIDGVLQPQTVAPGDTMSVTVTIRSEGTDPNPHAVFFTVLAPKDWTVTGVAYQSEKFGSGEFLPSPFWADSCEAVYPSGPDYVWLGFLSAESFLADEASIPATLTCTLRAGATLGDYQIGYTLGEDALGYDTSWGNVYDYSFNNPVSVIGQLQVPRDFPTIQQAIDAADSGMIISISPGTYSENVILAPGISLFGDPSAATIVEGNGQGPVVHCAAGSQLHDLTIQRAGQGFHLVQVHSVDSVVIADNRFSIASGEGGISIEFSNGVSVTENEFVGSNYQDGGIQVLNSELVFRANTIRSCAIGIDVHSSAVDISRNLLVGSGNIAAVFNLCPGSSFHNNTLSDYQDGLESFGSTVSIFNNIFVNGTGFGVKARDHAAISYNDVWNNAGGNYVSCAGGQGAISADPLFSGADTSQYGLSANSPCIDAGDPNSGVDPDGTVADMGAFYFAQPGIASPIRYVYLVHFTHLDIGFTDPQDVVADQYKTIIDKAIQYIDDIPTYKWTIESIWQLDQWLKRSTPQEIAHFREQVQSGRMDMCAGYATMHSATLGVEEMSRFLYPAARYRQDFGFELNTIYQNDVPGYAWALPSVLANAGVKYLATGINDAFGGGPKLPRQHNPFYWQGPDGNSVLTWISYGSYIEWYTTFNMSQLSTFYQSLSAELADYKAAGYPYDAIMIMVGKIENTEPTTLHTGMASLWNKTYANPRMIVARPEDFFVHLEEKYGAQFETYRGDWSGGWDHISLNTPQSMAMNRAAHELTTTAEKLAVIQSAVAGASYPAQVVNRIYENMLQFDEHSGGGTPWPGLMTYDEAQHQSEIAFHYAKDAYDSAYGLVDMNLAELAAQVSTESPGILVFNPLSWERSDVVTLPLSQDWLGRSFSLVDAATGSAVPFQILESTGDIKFTASQVPSVGYKVFHLVPSPAEKSQGRSHTINSEQSQVEAAIANDFYRVTISPVDGSIISLFDKQEQRELIDGASQYQFNGCIKANSLEAAAGDYVAIPPGAAQIDSSIRGDVAKALVITRSGSPFVRTEIWLYQAIPRVDIVNTMDRNQMDWVTQDINFEYYAYTFPFDLSNFDVRLEGAHGFWNPATDHLPGAPRGYFAVQHGGCLSDGGYSIHWANRESFVVEFDTFHGLNTEFDPATATLISRFIKKEDEGMFANGSVGPIIGEPGASPMIVTHYSFAATPGSFDDIAAAQFNWAFSNPLLAKLTDSNETGSLSASAASFFSVDPANVMLVNVKQAEDENGAIFRLLELSGTAAFAQVASDVFQWHSAQVTDGVENTIGAASVNANGVQVAVNSHELKTLRANFSVTGVNNLAEAPARSYRLLQNYPNPFNPNTTIGYELPRDERVTITVYNVNGQLVCVLVDEIKKGGQHRVEWDGKNSSGQSVTSGVYFYRLRAGDFVKQRKLLVLR
ncbi:MAG: T9SS type A sorting domain-containing protein [Candidatus Zhuqueibacterota bacterium]